MPLIVIVGQPCSGKSTAAGLLARLFRNKGLDVIVIDEPSLHVDRNEGYKSELHQFWPDLTRPVPAGPCTQAVGGQSCDWMGVCGCLSAAQECYNASMLPSQLLCKRWVVIWPHLCRCLQREEHAQQRACSGAEGR